MNLMPRRPAPRTLRRQIMQRVFNIAAFTFLAGALLQMGAASQTLTYAPHQEGVVMPGEAKAPAKGTPDWVWAKHSDSCWRGADAPKADMPGAAILHMQGGKAVYTKDQAMVSSAFDEALASMGYGDHEDARFSVIAFCI